MTKSPIVPVESSRKQSTGVVLVFILFSLSVVILVCDNVSVNSIVPQIFQNTVTSPRLTNATSALRATLSSDKDIHPFHDSTEFSSKDPSTPLWNISIVVQLSGELGNHLSKLAFAYAIQRRLWEHHAIHSHFILQHQEHNKWVQARQNVQECFPEFRTFDFTLGNGQEFQQRLAQQQQWLGHYNASQLVLFNLISTRQIDERLFYLKNLLQSLPPQESRMDTAAMIDNNHTISLPFIHAQSFVSWEFVDTYYYGLKDLFTFDETACCLHVPDPDEHVLHFRNFVGEMPRRGIPKGYQEIPPDQSIQLFSTTRHSKDTSRPTKIAITTRIHNVAAQAYVDTLTHHGWSARMVQSPKDVQDFCFLQHTSHHLVGGIRSTFVQWAGLLGNASTVTLYSIHCNETLRALGPDQVFFNYSFQTLELQKRIRFVTITP